MTPDELENIGLTLFPGHAWQTMLSRALGVDRKTIRRWHNYEFDIPKDKEQEMFDLVKLHLKIMTKLVKQQNARLK